MNIILKIIQLYYFKNLWLEANSSSKRRGGDLVSRLLLLILIDRDFSRARGQGVIVLADMDDIVDVFRQLGFAPDAFALKASS